MLCFILCCYSFFLLYSVIWNLHVYKPDIFQIFSKLQCIHYLLRPSIFTSDKLKGEKTQTLMLGDLICWHGLALVISFEDRVTTTQYGVLLTDHLYVLMNLPGVLSSRMSPSPQYTVLKYTMVFTVTLISVQLNTSGRFWSVA